MLALIYVAHDLYTKCILSFELLCINQFYLGIININLNRMSASMYVRHVNLPKQFQDHTLHSYPITPTRTLPNHSGNASNVMPRAC